MSEVHGRALLLMAVTLKRKSIPKGISARNTQALLAATGRLCRQWQRRSPPPLSGRVCAVLCFVLSLLIAAHHQLRRGTWIVRVTWVGLTTECATAAAITRSAYGMAAIVQYRVRPQCPLPSRIELRWFLHQVRTIEFLI